MSAGPRMPLAQALDLAVELQDLLAPACERIQIAGSIRRLRETVGDLELVAIPRMRPQGQVSLFRPPGQAIPLVSALWERLEMLVERHSEPCGACGSNPYPGDEPCPVCKGLGLVGTLTRHPPRQQCCPACKGAGGHGDETCARCGGLKWIVVSAQWGDRYRKLLWRGVPVDLFTAREDTWGSILLIRTGPPAYSQEWVTRLTGRGLQHRDGQVQDAGTGGQIPTPTEEAACALVRWTWEPPERRDGLIETPGWARAPGLVGR